MKAEEMAKDEAEEVDVDLGISGLKDFEEPPIMGERVRARAGDMKAEDEDHGVSCWDDFREPTMGDCNGY
jgi:hypothetical protein